MADGLPARRAAAAQVLVEDPDDPVLSEADRHHLLRVLRLGPGEQFVVTDGRGRWRLCRFTRRGPEGALTFAGPVEAEPAPSPILSVAFVPAKAERPDWVVQRLTEIGVDRVAVVASSARSVVRIDAGRAEALLARLRAVAVSAACQSRRVWLPEVAAVTSLAELPAALGSPPALAEPGGPPIGPEVEALAVGPEGGWAPAELFLGWPTVGLGPTVLRAETAALVAGTLLCARRAGTLRWAQSAAAGPGGQGGGSGGG